MANIPIKKFNYFKKGMYTVPFVYIVQRMQEQKKSETQ